MKTKQDHERPITVTQRKYKYIVFRNDTHICKQCLNKLKKQQIVDWRVHNQNYMGNIVRKLAQNSFCKNIAVDGDMMINKSTSEFIHLACLLYLLLVADQQTM